jgi:serine/threonine protein kinase
LSLLLTKPINTLSNVEGGAEHKSLIQPPAAVLTRSEELRHALQHTGRSRSFAALTAGDVQLVRRIGSGQACDTFEGVLVASNMPVAVKKPLSSCTSSEAERSQYSSLWAQELTLMELIGQHPNICTFVGLSLSTDSCDSMFLCYEFLPGGCLADLLGDPARQINPLKVAAEVARGMRHLHRLRVMHRDLKPANVILDSGGCAKIADFGLSCRVNVGSEMTAETGTYRWMAPEVIRHEHYSLAADVYSFGILLWELFARRRPFDDLTPLQAAYQVALAHWRPPVPPHTPPQVRQLLEALWHRDAAARPTFEDICGVLDALLLDSTPSDDRGFCV